MHKNTAGLIAIVLVLSSLSGFLFIQKTSLEQQVSTLTSEKESLTTQVKSLTAQVNSLTKEKENLTVMVTKLSQEKARLQSTVSELNTRISQLQSELNQAHNELSNAITSYWKWVEFLLSYSQYLNYTVKRVFSDDELKGLMDLLMNEVLSNPKDTWSSYQDIYNWITSNINYAHDEPFPLPPAFNDFIHGNFSGKVVYDSVMAPSETLELKQGDCDDQAVLAYAMIKSYLKYIYGREFILWLMVIEFEKMGHMAVALPAVGSNNQILLTIIDPAGHYLTKEGFIFDRITAKDPFVELNNYKSYWAEHGETIQKITLYKIEDGVAYVVVSGSVSEVASFIANL